VPVTKLGRIAGQFATPRSAPTEMVDGVELDSYRGDIINDSSNDPAKRVPDPARMVTAYDQCANTLNLLRAFATGGYASLRSVHGWNLDFINDSAEAAKFAALADRISETLAFLDACGMDTEESPIFASTPFYTSHEALLLPYEEALTRQDSTTGDWYCTSAHFLWVGERTRQLGKAHLEFLRGVKNPLGVKVSDKASPDEILKVLDVLDPDNTPGRVTLISRMGADALREHYPKIVRAVEAEGRKVVWHSDPMHGNTIKTDSGFKTRKFDAIREELRAFFDAHEEMGTHAGGVHLEMTGQDVTECLGGSSGNVLEDDLGSRYLTHCDPRLNAKQSLELAFLIAEGIRRRSGKTPLFTSPGSSGVGPRAPLL
jgi:3-deoxy-7-phosphoheptulonate synthase